MPSQSIWPTIHAEREALADDLAGLSAEQWRHASLCEEWAVHDVLAHLLGLALMTPFGFLRRLAVARFDFDRYADSLIAEVRREPPSATLAAFREATPRTSAPPGPKDTWLGEHIVHGEDIRRPLGLSHTYPIDAVLRALDFYVRSNAIIGGKDRVAGITLRAADADHAVGSGPEVTGPALDLLLAASGRPSGLAALSGPGLDTLSSRVLG